MKERGLGYNEIERRSGRKITHSFLSKLVSGATANPRLDKLGELADLFGVSIGEIVGETGEEFEEFRMSKFRELHDLYEQLEKPHHRKSVDKDVRDLVEMMKTMPKRSAEDSLEKEALRKSK